MRHKPILPLAALFACTATIASAEEAPSFNNERWREDWSGSSAAGKDLALGGLALDIGGDVRWKPEAIDSPRYGLTSFEDDSWLQQRLLLHFNLRAEEYARLYVELGAFDVIDRANETTNDDNQLDVQQAFFDITPHWGETELRLRVGRQEIPLGDRFFDLGDSSNIRLHYDAVRLTLSHGAWEIEGLALEQVQNNPGVFDDEDVEGQDVFGAWAERSFEGGAVRVFYYQHNRDNFPLAAVTANDERASYGAFAHGERGAYDGAFEIVRQTGDHGALDIDAWGAYAELGRGFEDARWSPRLGARITYGSGDSEAGDGAIETYAPPFPRGSWFSEAGLVSHANVVEFAGLASLDLGGGVKLDAKLAGLWRADDNDFVYVSSQTPVVGSITGEPYIGLAPRLQLNWRAGRHVTVRGELSGVAVSDDLEALGGEDVLYANASIAWRY